MTAGPAILARSLTVATSGSGRGKPFQHGNSWQYHPRSDRHSKIACWAIMFDLLKASSLLRSHVGRDMAVGLNHPMTDYAQNRTKNLDLVVCSAGGIDGTRDFASLIDAYGIALSDSERADLAALPTVRLARPSTVVMALEAKACMTEFGKARPRLYDELNSSHLTVHGDTNGAIAGGFVMLNAAASFVSPLRNPFPLSGASAHRSVHQQPSDALSVLDKLRQLPRRSNVGDSGFDAFGVVVIDCRNDGTPVTVRSDEPYPQANDIFHYDQMIGRLAALYNQRFSGY